MIWLVALVGALALGSGAFLASPAAHPIWGSGGALALAAGAALVALAGYALARQWVSALAIGAALAATIPPDLPMGWPGPALLAVGAVLSLEATRARGEGAAPPLGAWALPVGLALAGLAVPLAALGVQSGRESLDLAQGIGAAVSAPFVLLAAAGLLSLAYRGDGDDGDEADDGSGRAQGDAAATAAATLAVLAGLAVLVAGAGLATADTVERERFMQREVLVDDSGASGQDVSDDFGWTVDNSTVVLLEPDTSGLPILNTTVEEAELEFSSTFITVNRCDTATLQLSRATNPWGPSATWSTLPPTTNPRNRSLTYAHCGDNPRVVYDVTADARSWARGAPVNGWQFGMPEGDRSYTVTEVAYNVTFDPNPPEVARVETTPGTVPAGVIAPVGGNVTVTVDATDPVGGIRNATVSQDGTRLASAPFAGNATTATLAFPVRGDAGAPYVVTVRDWDGNLDRREIGSPLLDRRAPNVTVSDAPAGPVPRGSTPEATLDLSDDLCADVTPCLNWTVRDENGDAVANGTGNGTAAFTLPTEHAGPRELVVSVADRAGRANRTTLAYLVSEEEPPAFTSLEALGALGRPGVQEEGLPVTVAFELDEESPPVQVDVLADDVPVGAETIETTTASIPVTVGDAGQTTLTVRVEDRWGNVAEAERTVTIEPRSPPIVLLPTHGFVSREPTLDVEVVDLTVGPENVSVEATVDGQPLPGARTNSTLTDTGLALAVHLPSLVDGEEVGLVVQARDAHGQVDSASRTYVADAGPPRVEVEPDPGLVDDGVLFTTPDGRVALAADDDVSSVARFTLNGRDVDPRGTSVPAGDLGASFSIVATDEAGNRATRNGTVSIDRSPPTVRLDVDGHDVVVEVAEEGSGLARSVLTVDGTLEPIPLAPGTHRVTLTDVRRGDRVHAELGAADRVGQEVTVERNLTVEDAPPRVTVGTVNQGRLGLSVLDPDGDDATLRVLARHAVNGTERTLDAADGGVDLPDWRGEVDVEVHASAHNATTTETRTVLLGEPPYLSASAPAEATAGREVTVDVSWTRRADAVTVSAHRDGVEVASADVDPSGDGEGTATFTFDESGTYQLSTRLVTPDGEVEAQSAGTVEVSTTIGWPVWLLVGLVALGLVGAGLYAWLERRDEDDGEPERI